MKNSDLIKNIIDNEIDPAYQIRSKLIINHIISTKPKRILDVGCGRGYYLKLLSLLDFPIEIVGIDLSEKYLQYAKKSIQDRRVKILRGSIYNLPFKDNYFDCIICSEVLEHLDNDILAVKQLKRAVKNKGNLLITVPHDNFPIFWDPLNWLLMRLFNKHVNKNIWWLAGIWADHERLYSEKQIVALLYHQGLKIKNVTRIISHCWPFSHFILYGIGKNIVERIPKQSINRFNYKKNTLSRVISYLFKLPDKNNAKINSQDRYMNIFISAQKSI